LCGLDIFIALCDVIAANCESPVNCVGSLPLYSDTDSNDLDVLPPLPMSNSSISLSPSLLQHADDGYHSALVQSHTCLSVHDMASCDSVCPPILVVPSSDSYMSLMRTPDSSPQRPRGFSPSQARCFQILYSESVLLLARLGLIVIRLFFTGTTAHLLIVVCKVSLLAS